MSSLKRKTSAGGLQRRVRARRESSEELEPIGSIPSVNGDQEVDEASENSELEEEDDEVCFQL
jgi:ribosomal RNA-processing protein 36